MELKLKADFRSKNCSCRKHLKYLQCSNQLLTHSANKTW